MTLANDPPWAVEQLAAFLERAGSGAAVEKAALTDDLLSLLDATGTAHDGSEEAEIWAELAAAAASHQALKRGFLQLADAPDPLDPVMCSGSLRAELSGKLYNRWAARWKRAGRNATPSYYTVVWADLNPSEQDEVRDMARDLARYHRSFIRAQRPAKNDLDTLLDELAHIFVRHSGLQVARHALPHAVEGRFVRFASVVLSPFYDPSEAGSLPLARRWNRLKARAAAGGNEGDTTD